MKVIHRAREMCYLQLTGNRLRNPSGPGPTMALTLPMRNPTKDEIRRGMAGNPKQLKYRGEVESSVAEEVNMEENIEQSKSQDCCGESVVESAKLMKVGKDCMNAEVVGTKIWFESP